MVLSELLLSSLHDLPEIILEDINISDVCPIASTTTSVTPSANRRVLCGTEVVYKEAVAQI
jgi:hypothetical protein